MDQEQLAAGGAAIRGQSNEAAVEAALAAGRRDEASGDVEAMGSREFNDFVIREAAAGTTTVGGARSEDQQPRQQSSAANSGPRSGRVSTGAATASAAAAARVRQHEQAGQGSLIEGCSDDEDARDKDMREFDDYVKMQLQQQQTQQLPTRLQQHPSPFSRTEGGGRRRRGGGTRAGISSLTRLRQHPSPSSTTEGGDGREVAPAPAPPASDLDLELRL